MPITLKKNGNIIHTDGIYKDAKEKKVKDFIPYLREEMIIEEGTTFETLFNIIMKDIDGYSFVFSSHLGHYPLSSWKDEWAKKDVPKENDEMYAIEIGWLGYDRFDPDEDCFTNPYFDGVGTYDGREQNFGIEYTPIHELKHYPMRLSKKFVFRDNNFKEEFAVNMGLTVYDVIGAILYEISWSGDPSARDKTKDRILADIDEVQKELKKEKTSEL